MITFKKLKYKNFLSTGDMPTELVLNKDQNTLIVGENGSGKSAILDAICFVLFGKAFRNVVKGSLVNSINDKNCLVEIDFTTNNKKYKIIRGIKPVVFEIYCDDVLVNQDSASRDYQAYLEKNILKMTYKSFTQIVILGSASYFPFMQLKPADRRVIIEDLLDIQIFSVMNTVVKNKHQVNREDLNKNGTVIQALKDKIEFIKKTIVSLNKMNEQTISSLQEKRQNYTKEISDFNKLIQEYEERKNSLLEDNDRLSKLKDKINSMEAMKNQALSNLNKISENISFLTDHDNCPVCEQSIDDTFKSNSVEAHTTKKNKINDGIVLLDKKIKEIEQEKDKLEPCVLELKDLNQKHLMLTSKISSMNRFISEIDKEISEVGSSSNMLDEYTKDLENVKTDLKNTELEREQLLQDKTFIETSILLLKDGGIKTKIIKQYIPIINSTINKYLSQMGFFVNFQIDENFEETIKSRHRDEFSYNSFSEGEKFRIDLAILLTWRHIARLRNSVNCNLLILDEVFDGSLDINGIDEFLKIMWNLFDNTNVFIISHKTDAMLDKFKTVHRFKKVKNFSIIQT